MSFWEREMPVGMFLRSNWTATQIADPNGTLTLEAYEMASGSRLSLARAPRSLCTVWPMVSARGGPHLDRRKIARIESMPLGGFRVTVADGEALRACRIVIAAGIGSFAWRPRTFEGLPSSLASHTSEHHDLAKFAGKRVLVVGSGQSALESAALLHENGAEAEVVARAHKIHWLQGSLVE